MAEILGAIAAITAAVAAVISALKSGEAAGAVTKLKQEVTQWQGQIVSLQQAISQQQNQNQNQQIFTGPMTFTGVVHQHLPSGATQPTIPEATTDQTELFGEQASPLNEIAVETPRPAPGN